MKRLIIGICIILILFAGCVTTDTDTQSGSKKDALSTEGLENLLENSGFEEGMGTWSPFGSCSTTVSTDQAHSGSSSCYVTERGSNWQGAAVNMLPILEKGSTYIFAAWVMLDNASSSVFKMTIKKKTGGGDNYEQAVTKQVKGKEWVQLIGKYTLESTDEEFKELTLYIEGPDPGINYYLDDVEVVLIEEGDVSKNTSPETSDTEQEMVARNTIINPGFENGTKGWTPFGTCDISLSIKEVHSGNNAVYVSNRSGDWNGVAANVTSLLQRGESYSISGWVFPDNTASATFHMSLMQTDDTGDNFIRINSQEVTAGKWVQLSGEYTVESSTITGLVLYIEGPDPEINYFVDDVVIELLNQ